MLKLFKFLIIALLVFFFKTDTVAQDGFKIIRKAEKQFEKKHYQKTLNLLAKADTADYGFCGNAHAQADNHINFLYAKTYMAMNQYANARKHLKYNTFCGNRYQIDSMIWVSYQMQYGKDSLSKMVDVSLSQANMEYTQLEYYIHIPLTNGDFIHYRIDYLKEWESIFIFNGKIKAQLWVANFKQSTIYKMVKG